MHFKANSDFMMTRCENISKRSRIAFAQLTAKAIDKTFHYS